MALGNDSSNDSRYDQSFYRLTSLSFAIFERTKIEGFPSVVENPSSLTRRFNRSADPSRAKVEDLTRVYVIPSFIPFQESLLTNVSLW